MTGVNNFITDLLDQMVDHGKGSFLLLKPTYEDTYFVRGIISYKGKTTIDTDEFMLDMEALGFNWQEDISEFYFHTRDGDKKVYRILPEITTDEFTGNPIVGFYHEGIETTGESS